MLKRFFCVLVLSIFLFSSVFVFPAQRTYAALPAVLAVAAGSEVAVGAYVLGALAVASFGTALGLQYGDEIRQHSLRVWDSANQSIKDSLKQSISLAYNAGSSLVNISQDVIDFLKSSFISTYNFFLSSNELVTPSVSSSYSNISLRAPDNYIFCVYSSLQKGYFFTKYIDVSKSSNYAGHMLISASSVDWNLTKQITAGSTSIVYLPQNRWIDTTTLQNNWGLVQKALNSYGVFPTLMTLSAAQSFSSSLLQNKDYWSTLVDSVLSDAKSVGVYVPDTFVAYPVDNFGVRVSEKPLVWDDASKVWKRNDGTTWTGAIDWAFPLPVVDSDGKVVVGDTISVGTGAGTKVGTGAGTGTGTGTSQIDFSPLLVAFSDITKKFPFSIPFDFFSLISFLSVEPVAPKFSIDVSKNVNLLGVSIPVHYSFTLDFSTFDWIARFGRWFLLIVFDISLILALRRFTPD
ncbi:MAG: hypothetical protein K6T72_14360 [Anoxybacillus sp.]|nr:hypothetical protein [Anoxybacillus sp.]MCL6587669.1 hypothetical protein [Anoxybacillus sp.]